MKTSITLWKLNGLVQALNHAPCTSTTGTYVMLPVKGKHQLCKCRSGSTDPADGSFGISPVLSAKHLYHWLCGYMNGLQGAAVRTDSTLLCRD